VYRDLDILRSFQAELTVVLGLPNLAQIVQAGGSSNTPNIELATKLHSEGVTVWAFVMPVLPGITDVHAIMGALPPTVPLWLYDLQMNDKSQTAPPFRTFLAQHFPHLTQLYRQMLGGSDHTYYGALREEFAGNDRVKFPYG
jgi:DNA repair photolyase